MKPETSKTLGAQEAPRKTIFTNPQIRPEPICRNQRKTVHRTLVEKKAVPHWREMRVPASLGSMGVLVLKKMPGSDVGLLFYSAAIPAARQAEEQGTRDQATPAGTNRPAPRYATPAGTKGTRPRARFPAYSSIYLSVVTCRWRGLRPWRQARASGAGCGAGLARPGPERGPRRRSNRRSILQRARQVRRQDRGCG